jgi:hypothetical protein
VARTDQFFVPWFRMIVLNRKITNASLKPRFIYRLA